MREPAVVAIDRPRRSQERARASLPGDNEARPAFPGVRRGFPRRPFFSLERLSVDDCKAASSWGFFVSDSAGCPAVGR